MQVFVSPEIDRILDEAARLSARRGQYFVGVEHLFEALMGNQTLLPREVMEHRFRAFQAAGTELARNPWQGTMPAVGAECFYTPRCAAVINDAGRFAKRLGWAKPGVGHLLMAMLADAHAAPCRILDQRGFDRGECIKDLRRALLKSRPAASQDAGTSAAAPEVKAQQAQAAVTTQDDQAEKAPFSLESITRDLTQAARAKKIEPAIGRDKEIVEMLQILMRKNKNNVILVGDAGVGKTKVVEGLAVAAARGGVGEVLAGYRILELNHAALMSGTQYRGAFEEKVTALLEELKRRKDVILFIDEIHLIMGAGATDGGAVDLANLLKPALGRGEFRCIGATTLDEYRKFIERDPAIERRFQMVRLNELTESATYAVLKALQPSLESHHGVRISNKALLAAIKMTQRYMPGRKLPDKAIDVLDQCCARYRLKAVAAKAVAGKRPELGSAVRPSASGRATNAVLPHDVRKVVSLITAIPLEEITAEERLRLGDLERRLRRRIVGQDEAVARAVAAVKKSRTGLADPNRPTAVLLFLGPSGVGKSQLAKELTDTVFGSSDHLYTFDMSEYVEEHSVSRLLGAPPGYAGSDEEGRLARALRKSAFSVLLFDEIEKAHPRVFDILLPILDEGRSKDSRGRDLNFKNCIIILTSNVAAATLSRSRGKQAGAVIKELRQHFRPEFINRIDEIVPFHPLLFEDIRTILHLHAEDLRRRLKDRGVGVRIYQGAYEHLAEQGYSEEFGARELRRVFERHVINPASDLLLDESFERGDVIEALMEDGKLVIRKGQRQEREGAAPA